MSPVDEDVLAAGDLRMEARAQLDQRGNPALSRSTVPVVGLVMPATSLSAVLLPGPVPADDAVRAALGHREGDVLKRRERLGRAQVAQDAALQKRALERGELTPAVAPVDLRHVLQLDRRRHTTSTNESRSRSNSQ